jgi:hypothetical protein
MPRMAIQLSENLFAAVAELVGADLHDAKDAFSSHAYMIISPVGPTEFNLKIVSEEEIFEAAADDSELQIVSF